MLTRYGTNKILEIPGVAEKQASTNKQRYGCANPFANEDIKQKIMDTNIKKYGVAYYTQTEEYLKKKRATSLQNTALKNGCVLIHIVLCFAEKKVRDGSRIKQTAIAIP